jgi:TatA/E family protein of Tat protein translocase
MVMNILALGIGNLGGPDLFIILLIVLVLFGAKKLPDLARSLGMNLWLAGAAVLLAILGSFQLLNPYVLLFCVFLIGVGFAFHAPAWSATVPDPVTDEDLPSAATLGGLQLNVSGIIGPALGGVLLYLLGANWVLQWTPFVSWW